MPQLKRLSCSVGVSFGLTLGIAALAGYLDAYTFRLFAGLFVSFISGSTVVLGSALAQHQASGWQQAAQIVGLFAAGVVLGALLYNRVGSRWGPAVLLGLLAGLLLLPAHYPTLTVGSLSLGMGVLNASVHRIGKLAVSPTFFTGALVQCCTALANQLSGLPVRGSWGWYFGLWSFFLAGAWVGASAVSRLSTSALLPAAGVSLVLAGLAAGARGVR